jgi:hypothetical protein
MAKEEQLGLPDRWRKTALIFNTQPAAWLHDSWFDLLPHGAMARRLSAVPQATPQLSAYLLRAFGLERNYCENFTNPWTRLALLDGLALESLFLHVGLALRGHELQYEVMGERLRPLKQALGVEEWKFAIKRVPLLGVIPAFAFEPDVIDLRTRFTLIGGRFCTGPLTPFGPPLMRRLTLKLPAAWSASLNAPNRSSDAVPAELPSLLRKLIKDLLPTWNPLFA